MNRLLVIVGLAVSVACGPPESLRSATSRLEANAPAAAKVPHYSFTALPYLGEQYGVDAYHQAFARAINNLGQVVGVDQTATSTVPRAFIWSPSGGMQYFENTLPGKTGLLLEFLDINDHGEAVGNGYYVPVYWSAATGLLQLPLPSGVPMGVASAINDHGVIVGEGIDSTYTNETALKWPKRTVATLLPMPSGYTFGSGNDVNDKGQVIGVATDYGALPFIVSKTGAATALSLLTGHTEGYAFAINANGDVVGGSASPSEFQAVIWPDGGAPVSLGSLPGLTRGGAAGINKSRTAVGSVTSGTLEAERAFVWTASAGMVDLNSLVDELPANVTLREASAINDFGQILVYGYDTVLLKSVHAVLTPIPR